MAKVAANPHNEQIFHVSQKTAPTPMKKQQQARKEKKKKVCWYHGKFRKNATFCRHPVPWRETGTGGAPRTRSLPLSGLLPHQSASGPGRDALASGLSRDALDSIIGSSGYVPPSEPPSRAWIKLSPACFGSPASSPT